MCRNHGRNMENIPCVFVLWNNFRGFYLRYRVIILHLTLIGRMWVRPSIGCWARGSKGGSGHPITALTELTWRHMSPVHSQLKLVKWAAIMGEFCGLWIELIRVDWCQAVRVGSEWYHLKLGGCLHFLRCGRLQKAMTGIMIARWTRGTAPWPRARIMQITVTPCVCEHVYSV